jgi:leader peptidase (prepilin peptidase)/N-methyltransferase
MCLPHLNKCGRLALTTTKETTLTEILTTTPATLLAAIVAALLASGVTTFRVRKVNGGTVTFTERVLFGLLYFAEVAPAHKRRRAALEVTTAVATVAVALSMSWAAIPFAFAFAAIVSACATDIRIMRLPHRLTRMNAIASLAFAIIATQAFGGAAMAVLTGLALALFYFAVGIASNGKLGMGDVYLALGTGTMAGTFGGLWGGMLAFIATAASAMLLLLVMLMVGRGRVRRDRAVPFGPHIAVGALAVVALGIIASYSPASTSAWGRVVEVVSL